MTPSQARIVEAKKVLLVAAREPSQAVPAAAMDVAGSDWLTLDPTHAVTFLRSEPFVVSAVVIAGDGESPAMHSLIADLKEAAPGVPIVFVDERESATSEVKVRRAGIQYYTHAPVSTGEISAVLDGLAGGGALHRVEVMASRPTG